MLFLGAVSMGRDSRGASAVNFSRTTPLFLHNRLLPLVHRFFTRADSRFLPSISVFFLGLVCHPSSRF